MTFSVTLSKEEQNQTIPHQPTPQTWHVMYVDRHTCQEGQIDGTLQDVQFQITLLNPDAAGNPLDHFSAEEAGESLCWSDSSVFQRCSVCSNAGSVSLQGFTVSTSC